MSESLAGQLLLASPSLMDPNFARKGGSYALIARMPLDPSVN
jgi:hypothetical protein